jgi:Fe-S cluster biogenesis protein NfuA
MFIQTEETPNPAVMKFLPGETVMRGNTLELPNPEQARVSPLASRLFEIEGVVNVFLGHDFVSITRAEDKDWYFLKPFILGALMEHFLSGAPVVTASDPARPNPQEGMEEQGAIVAEIIELLDTRVRPMVAQDGGDIVFDRFEEGVVWLRMQGACSGCPRSTATLKAGVENMLKHYIPEIQEVRAVQENIHG